jgi:4-amino-4-deoxy-L-arabinose transferase-like glycosyltransferase
VIARFGRWLRTPDARWLIAVTLLAFVVRLAVIGYVHPNPRDGRFDDSVWYDGSARHLAAGDGYVFDPAIFRAPDGSPVYPDDTRLTPTALWPPGYPATLAVVYKLTGNSLAAGRLLNVLLGSATVALVFLIARRLFGRTEAVFAGLALAVLPSHALFTAVLLSETEFGFLLALVLAICVYFVFDRERRPRLPLLVGLGALAAFTGYVRGEFLLFGGVIALLLLIRLRRQALKPLAALALGAALVITPWVVRNQLQLGSPVVGTTGSGRVAYQGHNPDSDGGPSLEATFKLEGKFQGLDRKQIELKSNREGSKLAREWAWDHPLEELKLVPQRMFFLFRSDESGVTWIQSNHAWFGSQGADRLIRISSFSFFGLIAVALAGAPLWWDGRDLRRMAVFAVAPFTMLIFGVLFIGDPRYHYALYVPLAVLAAPGLATLWRMTGEQFREVSRGRSLGQVLRTYGTPPSR